MKNNPYFTQAKLMLQVMPHVAAETCFALKGGTAINLFVQDMPRLSVDIDLAYLPVEGPREKALANISDALNRIAVTVEKINPGIRVHKSRAQNTSRITKLVVTAGQSRIKIEPNEVIRGSVFPAEERTLTPRAEDMFELSVSAQTLSVPDLYGGKMCAALDRQHPRDLFDIRVLLKKEGITRKIRQAFVVYLASHDRPMHEVLDPKLKDIRQIYENEFAGMTLEKVEYGDLISAREMLIETLKNELTNQERTFLLSMKEGKPKWSALRIEGIEKLPAIQWKLINIQKMGNQKRAEALRKLKEKLGL